jgi:hypothetical protein
MSCFIIILNQKNIHLYQTSSMKKILIISQMVVFSHILTAQNNDASILEKYEMDGFRFELSNLSNLNTDSSVTKQVEVFNAQNQSIFKESFIGLLNKFSPSNILQMDVYDFDFDGFPDFRLIPIYSENYPNQYYTFDKKDGTFHLNCLLSSISNIKFYSYKKELIGFSHGNLSFITEKKSENIPQFDFTHHKIFCTGMGLKTVKIESKLWLNPWNGPYSNDIIEIEKNKYVQKFNYENCVFDYIGETTIEKSDFSTISPYFDIIPKIEIEKLKPLPIPNEIIPKRITLDNFNHPIRDTVIDKIAYSWVIYDLNHTPIEIGQDYTNNVRNGNWIFLDQNGRIVSIVNYINDTLNGIATYYDYSNDPRVTKLYGLILSNYKMGTWTLESIENRKSKFNKWKKIRYYTYDNGRAISWIAIYKNLPTFEAVYDKNGEESFWRFYDKKGKIKNETNQSPYKYENE